MVVMQHLCIVGGNFKIRKMLLFPHRMEHKIGGVQERGLSSKKFLLGKRSK